jgi:hypothetical protein
VQYKNKINNMDAIKFVVNYENYLNEIKEVVKPEYTSAIERLRATDPYDLIRPDAWFQSESEARGYVWTMFLKELNELK